jgi:tRNA G18 (ribose-2'-O)-methylase SpoU
MRVETIASAADPRLAPFRQLHAPARAAGVVAEGSRLVRRLLAAPRFTVRGVLGTPDALAALADALAPAAAPVYAAPAPVIATIAGFPFHRGCLAIADERAPATLDDVLAAPADGPALVVALERVSDPDNVGSIVRSAEAFGADGVLLSPGCGDALAPKALRASMGAALALPVVRVEDWAAALDRTAGAGHELVALTPDGAVDVAALGATTPAPPRLTLVCGSEHDGVAPATRARAACTLRVELVPGVDSLNVAVAAAIALHRLRPHPGGPRVAMCPPER